MKKKIFNIIGLIIIILIFTKIFFKKKESFDPSEKTVYIVWNDNVDIQGLGDKLRGTIAIYQYCRMNGIKCVFDGRFSAFGKYFKNSNSYNPNITIDTPIISSIDQYGDLPLNKLIDDNLVDKNEIYVCSNLYPNFSFTLKEILYLNYITEPINSLKKKVRKLLKIFPENFTIQHFRFIDGSEPDEEKCLKCYEILESRYESTDILISNSKIFKDFVSKKKDIITLNCNDCDKLHVGQNPTSKIIEYTLIEYYILTKSSAIKTCSEYWWISGFVYWPANFYNISIDNIQI